MRLVAVSQDPGLNLSVVTDMPISTAALQASQPATAQRPAALELRDVVKRFGNFTAVDGLSLSVPRASVLALLGPNGAGKTTTIEMCEGFSKPTSGQIRVLGLDPSTQANEVRRRIGIMLQGGGAYPGIRVAEMLHLVASYSANPLNEQWLLDAVGLSAHAKTSFRRLSGGQQQRLSLACALVGRPELVFLDEPTAGMDAQSRLAVWELISRLREDGVTIVLTTHLMDEAEALADHVVIIDQGRVVAQGTPAQLRTQGAGSIISLETTTSLDPEAFERAVPGVSLGAVRPSTYRLECGGGITPELIASVANAAAEQGCLIRHLGTDQQSLEDVFLSITGREMRN